MATQFNIKNNIETLKKKLLPVLHIYSTYQLLSKAGTGWTIVWIILLVLQGLLPALTIHLTRLLVDSLAAGLTADLSWESAQYPLMLAVSIGAILVIAEIFNSVSEWVRTAQAEIIRDYISAVVHDKAIGVDLAFYESPAYHDQLEQVNRDMKGRPLALLESSGSLLQNSITLISVAGLLIPYAAWLPLALFISTLPSLYVVIRYNRRFHRWWEQQTATRRRIHYYDSLLTNESVAAEIRIFDLGPHFKALYQRLRKQLRHEHLDFIRVQGFARLFAGGFAILISGTVMIWMVWRVWLGLATLGDLTLFYQVFNRGQSLLRTLLGNLGQIYSNGLFLGNLFAFLDLEPEITEPDSPLQPPAFLNKGININQITFSYPGNRQPVYRNFSLFLPAGKITAIVGANGAGKSTLLKLVCRFYDVESGSINIDDLDIRRISLKELRRMATIMFQTPFGFYTPVRQNISFGDLQAEAGLDQIEKAAQGAGAHDFIMNLPDKYDTMLGKYFAGGTGLSGGEWQKVALARAFFRNAPIMILDEPTSFVDSWAEAEWLDRLRRLVAGKTVVIITHRFTTAMQADIIHVMDQGQIIESGTHPELIALNGRYAQSWRTQTERETTNEAKPADDDEVSTSPFGSNGHKQGSGLEQTVSR